MVHVLDKLGDVILLLFSQAWSLTSCGKDAKEVCTIVNLELNQALQSLIVNRAIGLEWGYESYT